MGVIWALYRAGRELLEAGAAILGAFANLLGVLVRTLPHVMLAGIIALGGVWLMYHLDNSLVRMPTWLQASEQNKASEQNNSPENRQSSPPSGQQNSPPQDQKSFASRQLEGSRPGVPTKSPLSEWLRSAV